MTRKFVHILLIISFLFSGTVRADEGMWIPLLLEKYTIEDMQKKGLELSAEDIYSVNQASLKDAVPIFGGGCTSAVVSQQGLLITNHHCGYGQIQSHSSLEHDYLTNGFWAMKRSQELTNPGLKATFLVRMEDVTDKVLTDVTPEMSEIERQAAIENASQSLIDQAIEGTHYEASVKPFFAGNQYFLFVTEVFKDVRLVGAPPSAIGKFGGDTDNWMWPRHTGDFSVFRIYADENNQPAEYSPDNVPYKPKKHFTISIKGVNKGDFTMVYGYPGRTQQYLTSYAVDMIYSMSNPHKINIRQQIIDIMSAAMEADPKVRIQYASKYARVSNAWKKWKGENKGLKRLKAVQKKQKLETSLTDWINDDPDRKQQYGHLLGEYQKIYENLRPYQKAVDYLFEALFAPDIVSFAGSYRNLAAMAGNATPDQMNKEAEKLEERVKGHFKDYHLPTDKKLFATMLKLYHDSLDTRFHPEIFAEIEKDYNGDFEKYTDDVFQNSIFANEQKLADFHQNIGEKNYDALTQDPAYLFYKSIINLYLQKLQRPYFGAQDQIGVLDRSYINALREFQKDKRFYPDANFTLRIAYGKVDNYEPRDGVIYQHYTTLDGIMEKDNQDVYDYRVPQKLKQLFKTKNYGRYGENGQMHVCFTASNHTTGGNSGSPVINAKGQLIGLNFDRNWEGTMSDIMYDPDRCRNITLDIRYALFIIEKFAGAEHLIKEMTIVE